MDVRITRLIPYCGCVPISLCMKYKHELFIQRMIGCGHDYLRQLDLARSLALRRVVASQGGFCEAFCHIATVSKLLLVAHGLLILLPL